MFFLLKLDKGGRRSPPNKAISGPRSQSVADVEDVIMRCEAPSCACWGGCVPCSASGEHIDIYHSVLEQHATFFLWKPLQSLGMLLCLVRKYLSRALSKGVLLALSISGKLELVLSSSSSSFFNLDSTAKFWNSSALYFYTPYTLSLCLSLFPWLQLSLSSSSQTESVASRSSECATSRYISVVGSQPAASSAPKSHKAQVQDAQTQRTSSNYIIRYQNTDFLFFNGSNSPIRGLSQHLACSLEVNWVQL